MSRLPLKSPPLARLLLVAVLVGSAACSESPAGPAQLSLSGQVASEHDVTPALADEKVIVCKVGSFGNFSVSANGGTATAHTVADGQCATVFQWPGAILFSVAVTELESTSYELDSIRVVVSRNNVMQSSTLLTGVTTATVDVIEAKGGIITFFNTPKTPPPPPPLGGQGCTPGYWKQSQHFDSWVGYTPNTLFSAVFEDAFPGKTLLQVASTGGGGLNALGRHTVAALLNTSSGSVNYGIGTPAEVVAAFNAAFPGGDYEGLKNRFAALNEKGCPLN